MTGEFVDHPFAIKFLLRGVMQNVKPDQTYQKFLMFHSRHYRPSPAKFRQPDVRFSYLMAWPAQRRQSR
jgi:hypothetical protein